MVPVNSYRTTFPLGTHRSPLTKTNTPSLPLPLLTMLTAGLCVMYRPFSIQTVNKAKLAEDGKEATTDRRMMMENGHPGVEVDEAAIRRGENPYTKYYLQQGEVAAAAT